MATVVSGTFLIQAGNPWVAILPPLISTLCLLIIRYRLEYGKPSGFFDLRKQSWAFLIGDIVAMPVALLAAAFGWRELAHRQLQVPAWLILVAVVAMFGFVIAWTRHEAQSYASFGKGNVDRIGSPSKMWHDGVVYGSLSYLLVWGGVPVVVTQPLGWGLVMILALLLWLGLGIADGYRKLPPSDLHPRVQDTRLN